MQFVHQTRPRRKIDVGVKEDFRKYPHGLQFYTTPPTDTIALQEFGDYAVERLKVLKVVESVGIKHVKNTEKYKEALELELKKLRDQGIFKTLLKRVTELGKLSHEEQKNIYEDRKKDHVSHFILRLAYCKSEELRRWFVQQELDLFRFRFGRENNESIDDFLKFNNLDYKPIPDSEKKEIQDKLTASARESAFNVEYEKYYKVSFLEALDLVSSRRVYISKGFAYVPHSELIVLILTQYRMHLSKALAVTGRVVPQLDEEDRLLPLLTGLSKQYLGQDYTSKKTATGQVTADMVDSLSKKSFPLCMVQVHQALRQHHHLRHVGRMQYGLFLKAIGLSLDEAMKFWRTEFTKLIDPDKFDKQYSYNIRHNYGKEGKRANYTPYSCVKIIMSNAPGPGDHHGCPFRHTDADLLKQKLQSMHIGSQNVDAIISEVNKGAFQIACGRYFSATHNNEDFTPNHPNQYYDESQAILGGKTSNASQSQDTPRRVIRAPVGSNKKAKKENSSANDEDDFIGDDELAMAMTGIEESQLQSQ